MYSGDEYYGDEVTSPLKRPAYRRARTTTHPSCRPDDPCSLEEPCPAHEAIAAACRAQGVSVAIDLKKGEERG